MTNKTFHLTVPAADEELAADRLWQLGVEAVGIGPDVDGTIELWTSVGGSAAAIKRAAASLESHWTWRTADVVEPDETWRDFASPNAYSDDGIVVPAWQVADFEAPGGVVITAIEPATSFGLGDHPTTTLSLAMLAERLAARTADTTVDTLLDVGCGSGVLGVMAAQRGVRVIRAIDVSAGAIEATVANAALNGVSGQVEVDLAVLEDLPGHYDLVVANILAPVLVSLAPQLRRLTSPSGELVISGILVDDHAHVLDALAPMRVESTTTQGGWAAVLLRH
jgi:ribosomal protein L11 methyltransferase